MNTCKDIYEEVYWLKAFQVTSKDQQFDQSKESTAGPGTETGNSAADGDHINMNSKLIGGEQQGIPVSEQQVLSGQWGGGQGPIQGSFTGSFGFDGTSNGFPNLGSYPHGDFNQLMQFMPNGMSSNGLGGLPTMMGKLLLDKLFMLLKTMSNARFF